MALLGIKAQPCINNDNSELCTYVMRSNEMSLMSGSIKVLTSSQFGKANRKLSFAENLIKIGLMFSKL